VGDDDRVSSLPTAAPPLAPLRFDRHEWAGAVADLGVLVPIAVALIVTNGLSPTAVLLPAGILYIIAGWYFRLPVPVQPLKAFGAIAIAHGLGADEIAAGALLMGITFVLLGSTGLLDRVAKVFPRPIVRGIQLSVGLIFCKLAWGLVTDPPTLFADHDRPGWWLLGGALVVAAAAYLLRRHAVTLLLVLLAVAAIAVAHDGTLSWGPSALTVPSLSGEVFVTALVVLVVPQLPLTFANSCLATADVARTYFGEQARRVRPNRLALSFGTANLVVGSVSGMPVCHGAGGMTAHRSFGARSGGSSISIGTVLIALALLLGSSLASLLTGFPLPILAGLLVVAGILHITLLKDLRSPSHVALALGVGITGAVLNLAVALLAGLLVWWLAHAVRRGLPTDQ
jgi:MFS superfamily sulfate permease-like transporter